MAENKTTHFTSNTSRNSLKNYIAFILCPKSIIIRILYFDLHSLGVVIPPSNPVSTESEMILLDSPEFDSMLRTPSYSTVHELNKVTVTQVQKMHEK